MRRLVWNILFTRRSLFFPQTELQAKHNPLALWHGGMGVLLTQGFGHYQKLASMTVASKFILELPIPAASFERGGSTPTIFFVRLCPSSR